MSHDIPCWYSCSKLLVMDMKCMLIMTNILACLFLEQTISDYTHCRSLNLSSLPMRLNILWAPIEIFTECFRDVAKPTEFKLPSRCRCSFGDMVGSSMIIPVQVESTNLYNYILQSQCRSTTLWVVSCDYITSAKFYSDSTSLKQILNESIPGILSEPQLFRWIFCIRPVNANHVKWLK